MRKEVYQDHPTINWVLDHCKTLRLGLVDHDQAYVVPVNYDYEESTDGKYTLSTELPMAKKARYLIKNQLSALKPMPVTNT